MRSAPLIAALIPLLAAAALAGWPQQNPYGPVDPVQAASRQVRDAVIVRSDGGHHLLLKSLRQLRDPTLRPLFQTLTQADHWTLQLDGVLGLAELERGAVDPFLIEQIRDPRDRSAAIRAALALELVGSDEAAEMLGWKALSPEDAVSLLATRARLGGTVDSAMLEELRSNEDAEVSAVASLLLAELRSDFALLEPIRERLARLAPDRRRSTAVSVAQVAERQRAEVASGLLAEWALSEDSDRSTRLACLAAMLAIDPDAGLEVWSTIFARETTVSGRLRAALLLLTAEVTVPPPMISMLRGEGEVLEALADAAESINSGEGQLEALRRVIDGGHRLSIAWAMTALLHQPPEVAGPLYESLVRELVEDRLDAPLLPVAIEATTRLVEVAPDRLAVLLAEAGSRSETLLEALLVGVLASEDRDAAASVARPTLGSASRRCDSLALLAVARTDGELSSEELARLGIAAAGGGRLDPALQIQAAWIFLRRSGRLDSAIAAAFASP